MTTQATPVDSEFDAIVADLPDPVAPRMRNSIKWRIIPAVTKLSIDFVYAHDADEADSKARAYLDIPEGEDFNIQRIYEGSGTSGSMTKGVSHQYGTT